MHMIDRRRVQHSFGNQAHQYEQHAIVQKVVVARFCALLKRERVEPQTCLDIGAGSGMLLRSLRKLHPSMGAVGVDLSPGMARVARNNLESDPDVAILPADAEHLPFSDSSFDLVVSTSTFQWLNHLDSAFGEAFRVLKTGGIFVFSLFGEGTLHELKTSYGCALQASGRTNDDHTHRFFGVASVDSALRRARFTGCSVTSEIEIEMHHDVSHLLRSLKRIGAGNASPSTARGFSGKAVMQEMMRCYKNRYGSESGVPATYEVIYGIGRKQT